MNLFRDKDTYALINSPCHTADDARLSQRRPSGGDISAGQGKENIPAIVVMLLRSKGRNVCIHEERE